MTDPRHRRLLAAALAAALAATALASPVGATHDDGTYDEPIFYEWNRLHLDVIVVPPVHGQLVTDDGPLDDDTDEANPYANDYMRATLDALDHWPRAMEAFGPAWLPDQVTLDVTVLGSDVLDPTDLADPEIVVVNEEANPAWSGVAAGKVPLADACLASSTKLDAGAAYSLAPTNASWGYTEYYNVVSHEIGHCLGLGHTGDGTDPDTFHPDADVMSYGPLDVKHCPSNLNVEALTLAFGDVAGHPTSATTAQVDVGHYDQIAC